MAVELLFLFSEHLPIGKFSFIEFFIDIWGSSCKIKMSYSIMSPKNQICSYGVHFATVAEKHPFYSFLSRQGVNWGHYIFGSLVHYFF